MNTKDFILLVEQMREEQKRYNREWNPYHTPLCREIEKKVDDALEHFRSFPEVEVDDRDTLRGCDDGFIRKDATHAATKTEDGHATDGTE